MNLLTINSVVLIGNLGADPELRYTQSGTPVANFNIAVNRQGKDGKSEADWISIVCWQKLAEVVSQYCTKGQTVLVEGRLQSRSYETQDGSKRMVVEVVANSVKFGNKPGQSQQGGQAPQDDFSAVGGEEDFPF